MSINWETLIASATISVIVPLGIEYFAKPRLEARKEEILDAHRSRRELLAATVRIVQAADVVSAHVPGGAEPAVRGNVYVEQDRQYERLVGEVQRLADDAGRHARTFLPPLLTLVVGYTSVLQGLLMSARPRTDQADGIKELASAVALLLSPPRLWQVWRAPAHARALARVRQLVDLHTGG
ncbi:hypothetical protein [Nonomuraea typhae]|uniref:hypothetical protein n=1 Tax=Nonomuraea typhae TaxID=2603600 RepID=UPI0012FC8C7E|nr:hypothetical protein [Nonomuraea typhae]